MVMVDDSVLVSVVGSSVLVVGRVVKPVVVSVD